MPTSDLDGTDQLLSHPQGYGGLCQQGYYCEAGTGPLTSSTKPPTPCPLGKYGAGKGLNSTSQCSACPYGFLCDATGISDYTSRQCPQGSVCLTDTQNSSTTA